MNIQKILIPLFKLVWSHRVRDFRKCDTVAKVLGWRSAYIDRPSGRYRTTFLFKGEK